VIGKHASCINHVSIGNRKNRSIQFQIEADGAQVSRLVNQNRDQDMIPG